MHDHPHHRPHGEAPGHRHGPGHNGAPVAQWQTPHRPETDDHGHEHPEAEPDLDLVEQAFIDAFPTCPDPTSFLRLAGIPFEATTADGTRLSLLRVETTDTADVGLVTPRLGGGDWRYDPLPARLTQRRRKAQFVYFDGENPQGLSFAEARTLANNDPRP